MEDWKKKYEELFGHVQDFHKRFSDQCSIKKEIEDCIPELAESVSEDERIKRGLLRCLDDIADGWILLHGISKNDAIAYLEKQKEKKPKNILTDDDSLQTAYLKGQTDVFEDPEAYGLQKEQKPAEWSEEDEKFFKTALWHISYSVSNGKTTDDHCDTTDWLKGVKERLKSLRPQPHWKPSKEQMEAVLTAQSVGSYGHRKALAELYNDLKKVAHEDSSRHTDSSQKER